MTAVRGVLSSQGQLRSKVFLQLSSLCALSMRVEAGHSLVKVTDCPIGQLIIEGHEDMPQIVDVVVVLLTRLLSRILLGEVAPLRLPTILWEVFTHLLTVIEDVQSRRPEAEDSFCVCLRVDWQRGLTERMQMPHLRAQVLGDPRDTSARIAIRKLRIPPIVVHQIQDRAPVRLCANQCLTPNQSPLNLLILAAPIIDTFRLEALSCPPLDGLIGCEDLTVVVSVACRVSSNPTESTFVTDTWIKALPSLPLTWNPEGADDVNVWIEVHKDLSDKHFMTSKNKSLVPVLWESLELVKIVLRKVRIVEGRSLDTAVVALELVAALTVDETVPQPVVAVGIECQQPLTGRAMLPQTTMELEKDALLHLLRLIDPEEAEVIVLNLLRIVERQPMNHRPIDQLHVEVASVIEAYTLLGDTSPPAGCRVTMHPHLPG